MLEETSKTYSATYYAEKILNNNGIEWIEGEEVFKSVGFKLFLINFDNALRKIVPLGWYVETEDYLKFINIPHVGGNSNMINKTVSYISEVRDDGKIVVCMEVEVSVVISKD